MDERKSLVSDVVRHDIGNDLTIIAGYSEILKDIPEAKEFAEKILLASSRITQTLEFLRACQGTPNPKWLCLAKVVEHLQVQFPEMEIEFGQSVRILADCLLEKVFYNLIENANFHGKATKVVITVEAKDDDYVVVISDNGRGIAIDDKSRIFDMGFSRKQKGGGYGLYFCKAVVESTGMLIQESGVHGQGARFEIIVPKANIAVL